MAFTLTLYVSSEKVTESRPLTKTGLTLTSESCTSLIGARLFVNWMLPLPTGAGPLRVYAVTQLGQPEYPKP